MIEYLNIFIKSTFLENMILSYFLGMCSYLAVSKSVKTAIGLGVAVVFVLFVTIPFNWLIYEYLLKETGIFGVDLTFLSFIVFMAVSAAIVQALEMVLEKSFPSLYISLGIFLPLIAVNCAILGAALFMIVREYDFIGSTVYGLGSGAGWMLAIVLLAAIREKLRYAKIPPALQGLGIAFIITGLMGMAFMGLMGIKL